MILGEPECDPDLPGTAAARAGMDGDDWILFFSIHSVGDMEWRDSGSLRLFARKEDLADGSFSHVVAEVDSA